MAPKPYYKNLQSNMLQMAIRRAGQPSAPGQQPVMQQQVQEVPQVASEEYAKRLYSLQKRSVPGKQDTHFDHCSWLITVIDPVGAPAHFVPTIATGTAGLWQYRVPDYESLIIQSYQFFAGIYNESEKYIMLAEPFEFFSEIDFLIYVNGMLPVNATYDCTAHPWRREGWTILSKDPDMMPDNCVTIEAPPGSKIEVILRNHTYAYNADQRSIIRAGFRLRGFRSPIIPYEKDD